MGPLWFPRAEYESRFEKLRAHLDGKSLDGLLISWDTNIRYYTGLRSATGFGSLTRAIVALLPLAGKPVLWVHDFQAGDAQASAWFDDVRLYHQLSGAPVEDLAEEVKARGLKRLGTELGLEQRLGMSPNDFDALRECLPDVEWVDAADILWHQRMRKSPAECECLRQACHITARAYDAAFPQIHAGMTEREAARVLGRALLDEGADDIAFLLVTSGGGNYGRVSGLATNRRLERGDMFWVDMGAKLNDYCADFSRAGVVGGPTDQQKQVQELVEGVTAKGVERARPGVPVGEIVTACNEEMACRGQSITFVAGRVGHGIGMNFTEHPHVALYDPTVLEPGMAITVEPGIVEPFGTFHVEENLIVTDSGNEVISTCARELRTL